MWDGRLPTILQLQTEGHRVGEPNGRFRAYWLPDGTTWITHLDPAGREEVYAAVDKDMRLLWYKKDVHSIGEIVLMAAGVR